MQIWSRGCPECPAARVPCRPRSRRPGGRGWATARPPTSCGGSPAGPRRCPAQTQAPAHKTTINRTHNVKKNLFEEAKKNLKLIKIIRF